MSRIKEQVLRELGDQGADTLNRYYAQVEYTAYWCIRMLIEAEGIQAVIPEGGEDVVIIQRGIYRLHQIKTRDESQDPWTTADILPILCKQYFGRNIFSGKCCFHFVSDRTADTKTRLTKTSYGSLYRLKFLLDIIHNNQSLSDKQQIEINEIQECLIPKLREILDHKYDEKTGKDVAKNLLENTWIETDNRILRNPQKLLELENALTQALPGIDTYTVPQLREIYDRIVLLIIRKIIIGKSIEERMIEREDIMNCRVNPRPLDGNNVQLDTLPGTTPLEKKTLYGGFDSTEITRFKRQKLLAERTTRRFSLYNLSHDLDRLTVALLDLHGECRQKICREQGINYKPGPKILSMLRPSLPKVVEKYSQNHDGSTEIKSEIDEQFCLGLLWKETNECSAWWHGLESSDQEAAA